MKIERHSIIQKAEPWDEIKVLTVRVFGFICTVTVEELLKNSPTSLLQQFFYALCGVLKALLGWRRRCASAPVSNETSKTPGNLNHKISRNMCFQYNFSAVYLKSEKTHGGQSGNSSVRAVFDTLGNPKLDTWSVGSWMPSSAVANSGTVARSGQQVLVWCESHWEMKENWNLQILDQPESGPGSMCLLSPSIQNILHPLEGLIWVAPDDLMTRLSKLRSEIPGWNWNPQHGAKNTHKFLSKSLSDISQVSPPGNRSKKRGQLVRLSQPPAGYASHCNHKPLDFSLKKGC